MEITVTGLNTANKKFKHLWGNYIKGFKPWTHCVQCFEYEKATSITPTMEDGTYPLRDDINYFYLCGVGQPNTKRDGYEWERKFTNIHLAVKPRKDSVAAIGSIYGVTFVIRDAEAIAIRPLPDGFAGIADTGHTRCKNFQFGYQTFLVDEVGIAESRDIIRTLRP